MTFGSKARPKSYRGAAIHNPTIPPTTAAPPMRSERCRPSLCETDQTTTSRSGTSMTMIAQPTRMSVTPNSRCNKARSTNAEFPITADITLPTTLRVQEGVSATSKQLNPLPGAGSRRVFTLARFNRRPKVRAGSLSPSRPSRRDPSGRSFPKSFPMRPLPCAESCGKAACRVMGAPGIETGREVSNRARPEATLRAVCREIQGRAATRRDDQQRLVPTLHLDRRRTATIPT